MPTLPAFTKLPLALADRLSPLGPLLIRVVIGTAFVITGWGKVHNLDGVTKYFESLHIPLASVQAPMVAFIELIGGALIVLGLGTRVIAGLLIGVMAVAMITAVIPDTFAAQPAPSLFEGFQGIMTKIEPAYLAVFVYLALAGGGAISLDRLIWRNRA
jgi:putative oxidoreductase